MHLSHSAVSYRMRVRHLVCKLRGGVYLENLRDSNCYSRAGVWMKLARKRTKIRKECGRGHSLEEAYHRIC